MLILKTTIDHKLHKTKKDKSKKKKQNKKKKQKCRVISTLRSGNQNGAAKSRPLSKYFVITCASGSS